MKDTAYYKRLRIVENKLIDSLNQLEGKFGLSGFSERISRINNKVPRLKSLAQLDIISEFLEALIEIDEAKAEADEAKAEADEPKAEADEPKAEADEAKAEADEPKKKRGRKATKSKQEKLL